MQIPINLDGSISDEYLEQLAELVNQAIDDHSLATLKEDDLRTHLGISEIGSQCSRQVYYKFHWMEYETHSGRMHRLFKRGHREEERFISYLEGIGCTFHRHDKDGKQFKVSGVMGHYGGSCDGVVITPWLPTTPMLAEFKTHNTKSYVHYIEKGLHKSKPKHYDQMCGYGWKLGLNYGIYFPENKNDDSIEVTIVKLDWQRGAQLERKAEEIILAKEPPAKISDNPAYFECSYCTFKNICHYDATPQKNCRSCRMAIPVDNAEWYCSRYNQNIPKDFIRTGCDEWTPI